MQLRNYLYLALLTVVIINGLLNFKRLSKSFKVLFILITYTLFSEIVSRIIAIKRHNNMVVYHVMLPIEYILISTTYGCLFNSAALKTFIKFSVVPFIALSLANSFFLQPVTIFPSHIFLLSNGLMLLYSLLFFEEMLNKTILNPIYKQGYFWFNTATLTMSSTIFLQVGLLNYYHKHKLDVTLLDDFGYGINILYYLLIGFAFYTDTQTNNQLKHETR
jgi:hypothetical protein